MARSMRAASRFPLRLGLFRLFHCWRAVLSGRCRDFDRRRLANLDRNADGRRLIDRAAFLRIGVAALGREPGKFGFCVVGAGRLVGEVAQAIKLVGPLERGMDQELPHFGVPIAIDQRAACRDVC